MSYSCYISLKQIKGDEIPAFFKSMKIRLNESVNELAEEDYAYAPTFRDMQTEYTAEVEKKQREWATKIFTYRWFYMPEKGVLGVFGVPDCAQDLFDNTTYYQNSCDQDYSLDTWNGINFLEYIAAKWRSTSDEDIKQLYSEQYGDWDTWHSEDGEIDIDYYRRSMCYEEIWNDYFESQLWNDGEAIYISLFREWDDLAFIKCFAHECFKKYLAWRESIQDDLTNAAKELEKDSVKI